MGGSVWIRALTDFVGVEEKSKSVINITIYPNPALDYINVEVPQKSQIEILNVQGQLMKSVKANENFVTINVSKYASGMYFIKVNAENGLEVKKFVKE